MRSKQTNGFLEPAATVISRFGGARRLADLLGLDKSTVCQWRNPKPRGTGGLIPGWHHADLLALAKENGVRLRPADLMQRRGGECRVQSAAALHG
jgi:hypothetical protein